MSTLTVSEQQKDLVGKNTFMAGFLDWRLDGAFFRPKERFMNLLTYNDRAHHFEQLCFHLSWDWLMPVYAKIRDVIKDEWIEAVDDRRYDLAEESIDDKDNLSNAILSGDISQAHEAVFQAVDKYWKR